MGSDRQIAKLVVFSFIVMIALTIHAQQPKAQGIPGFECYRTVEETYATAELISTNNPDLATWTDVGDSWEKTVGLGGYDIMVLRLTNSAIAGPKPKIFITSAIHANEYPTAELITRFAELLSASYGNEADITWLLDYCEIHMILQANPDGRKKAEAGLSWRKNTNQNYCSPISNRRGADLNRNFQFKWNCCGGSSDDECHYWYHGAYAASEPETQAIQNYAISQATDQRGPDDYDPVTLDASGIYLCIHSGNQTVVQWPWSYTGDPAPNQKQLKTFGRKLAFFNGYRPQQAFTQKPMDGNEKDFAYGELGLASYAYELTTQNFQSCSFFENNIVEKNIPSLIYAMKASRAPYMLPAGPDAIKLSVKSTPLGNNTITLNAIIDDTRYNNSNGTEPTQIISAAEYYVDFPPWINNPFSPVSMLPSDGNFDSKIEKVEAVIDTSVWTQGRHTVFVRGQDLEGNWGAFSAVFIDLPWSKDVGNTEVFSNITTRSNRRTMPYAMPEDGMIQNISMYHNGGSGKMLLGLYADDGQGKPGMRLGATAEADVNSIEGWQTVDLIAPVFVSAGTPIWLAWVYENNPGIRYQSGSPGRAQSNETWNDGLPTAYGASTINNYIYSIYATYIPGLATFEDVGNTEVFSNVTTSAKRRAMPYAMPEDGMIQNISMYHNGGSGKMLLGLYADDGQGTPGMRLGAIAEADVNSIEGWQTVDLIAPVFVSAGTPIWLAWVYENNPGIRYQSGSPGRAQSNEIWNDGMPPYYGSGSVSNYLYSIYATYITRLVIFENVGNTEVFSTVTTSAKRRAMPYTMPEDGMIQNISMYHNGGSGKMLLGLYADDGQGKPGMRLGVTAEADVNSIEGWQTVDLIAPVFVSAGTPIWLAWFYENNPGIRYQSSLPGRAQSNAVWNDGMPADYGPSSIANYIYSIYATYSPSL